MKYRTRNEINSSIRDTGVEVSSVIRGWRSARADRGEDHDVDDFYIAHSACPECAGSREIWFHLRTDGTVRRPCGCGT